MLARVDEFDTLTPLIVTPTSSQPSNPIPPLTRPTLPRITSSDSPPPPRRSHHGKTLIVPLNASRYRVPVAPLLGTPDSRITSFEAGTTKSCATIPEDDENESPTCERIDDLISIDRTTASASDQKQSSSRGYFLHSSYNIILPVSPPEFQIPVPQYSPPSLPRNQLRPRQLSRETRPAAEPALATPEAQSPCTCTNSIGSPNSTDSPIDTTGSISDSFYINSDVISSANGIEEESEAFDDLHRGLARAVYSHDNLDEASDFVILEVLLNSSTLSRRAEVECQGISRLNIALFLCVMDVVWME
ncbi:hypothetical protein COOONC_10683 [Cooperia oncophora]